MQPTNVIPNAHAFVGPPFSILQGTGPIVATAIHSGHTLRPEVAACMALSDADRRREEDPYTDRLTRPFSTQIVVDRSRFEVDLNRKPEEAVYLTEDQAWGLKVWAELPGPDVVAGSLAVHEEFYGRVGSLLDEVASVGPFVVLDLHSYNHRRGGRNASPAPVAENPDVNIGTGSLDHERWGALVDRFAIDLSEGLSSSVTIAENVRFQGGFFSQWVNERYAGRGCALALEFKKTFVDEWTDELDEVAVGGLIDALSGTVEGIVQELSR